MFDEFERVRIKSTGIIGVIVDKTVNNGDEKYIVESEERSPKVSGYGKIYPLFDCGPDDLEKA